MRLSEIGTIELECLNSTLILPNERSVLVGSSALVSTSLLRGSPVDCRILSLPPHHAVRHVLACPETSQASLSGVVVPPMRRARGGGVSAWSGRFGRRLSGSGGRH